MAKYDADELKALGAKGQAFKNADGSFSYPIADEEDLKNAIRAVGRGNADHNSIRAYIIKRAKALGAESQIPDNWSADGSISDAKSAGVHLDFTGTNPQQIAADIGWVLRDGSRSAPTAVDPEVMEGLKSAKIALARVKATQLTDPDHATDPDDVSILADINAAEAAVDKAIVAQSKDGRPDVEAKSARVPVQVKRGIFADTKEFEPPVAGHIEVRFGADDNGDGGLAHFSGYASTTGDGYDVTDWMGSYRETILPGAFAKTLRETGYVPFLIDHEGFPLASTDGGTMQLAEDGTGLRTDAQLDRRQGLANDLTIALQRKDLSKMSFAFRAVQQTWDADYTDRRIGELQLFDASVVKNPANPATSAGLRSELLDVVGVEGRSVMASLAPAVAELRAGHAELEADDLERVLKVLRCADDHFRRYQYTGRARTFALAGLLGEVRAGKVLSNENQTLLNSAVTAFSEGMGHLGTLHSNALTAANNETDSTPNDDGAVDRSTGLTLEVAAARATALRFARSRAA